VVCDVCALPTFKSALLRPLLLLVKWQGGYPMCRDMPHFSFGQPSQARSNYGKTAYANTKTNTHTHTHPFNGPFSGTTRVSWYQKGKPIWIFLKQETVSGSGISWVICKSAPLFRQITMPAPHHSVFLQAECLSCCPTNSVKALRHLS